MGLLSFGRTLFKEKKYFQNLNVLLSILPFRPQFLI
jgi:hypothetical protein